MINTNARTLRSAGLTDLSCGPEDVGMELKELECFLVLAEELHFGRTAERLYLSRVRVSQLVRALEHRIGARLFERTSRRVRLTPIGTQLAEELRPAYTALQRSVDHAKTAARGVTGVVRAGFVGTANDAVLGTVALFEQQLPGVAVDVAEMALSDPFGPLERGEVDLLFVCTPVDEPGVTVGPVVLREPRALAVSRRHPFAGRASVSVEELADCRVVRIADPAPAYWRDVLAPTVTPQGRPVPSGPVATTLQEALTLVAADRAVMPFPAVVEGYHGRRDVVFVPVVDLPASELAVVWRTEATTERIRAFAAAAARYAPCD
jgi:DNA-binding transcriptional LysR family regulator